MSAMILRSSSLISERSSSQAKKSGSCNVPGTSSWGLIGWSVPSKSSVATGLGLSMLMCVSAVDSHVPVVPSWLMFIALVGVLKVGSEGGLAVPRWLVVVALVDVSKVGLEVVFAVATITFKSATISATIWARIEGVTT